MIQTFHDSISDAEKLRALHHHCVNDLNLPGDYDDLLRMGLVYCMSALDKLIHDIIIYQMVETFTGRRAPTKKFLTETISMQDKTNLANAVMPPPEIVFERIVRHKLSHLSFMESSKISDALSLIWSEDHKWQHISIAMNRTREQTITELKNLYERRNGIVHETDRDPTTGQKMQILPSDAERAENFIRLLGESIYNLTN